MISIHAPTKGATRSRQQSGGHGLFQSTLPRRERRTAIIPNSNPQTFQSTLPRRERHAVVKKQTTELLFQSTLPRRERLTGGLHWLPDEEFQSTLPRRERRHIVAGLHKVLQFQSTLPRRERRGLCNHGYQDLLHFNPRSHEGSDVLSGHNWVTWTEISIHAPTKGATS